MNGFEKFRIYTTQEVTDKVKSGEITGFSFGYYTPNFLVERGSPLRRFLEFLLKVTTKIVYRS